MKCFFHLQDKDRIHFLRYSFRHLVRHVINDGELVAIVAFSQRCNVLHELVELRGATIRQELANIVDQAVLRDYTAIGCGLRKALEVSVVIIFGDKCKIKT